MLNFTTLLECDRTLTLLHGDVTYNGTTVGDGATFSCQLGYKLLGDSDTICLQNGTWQSRYVSCEAIGTYGAVLYFFNKSRGCN